MVKIFLRRAVKSDWLFNNEKRNGFQYFLKQESEQGVWFTIHVFGPATEIEDLRNRVKKGQVFVLSDEQYPPEAANMIVKLDLYQIN